jgi:radical SAM-linked protein
MPPGGVALRLRLQFTKEGQAKFLSHSEYSRTLMISARRAGLPLEYAGQNMSRMKISLSPPLPIGITSLCEYVDFGLTSYLPAAEAQSRLESALPEGVRAVRAKLMEAESRPVGKVIDTAVYVATFDGASMSEDALRAAVESFLDEPEVLYVRVQPRRTRTVDLRKGVHGLIVTAAGKAADGVDLEMTLDDGIAGTVKPREVVEVLGQRAGVPSEVSQGAGVERRGLFARRGDRLVSPMDIKGVRRS